MKWPADRKFTDKDGKILDHWRGPMSVLEPLLNLTPSQFAALQQLIAAYIASQQDDGETDPGAIIDLALPIDNEPLPDEDWLLEYKNSAKAGRRVPISTLLARARSRTLISTTSLAGAASTDIPVPSGYTHIELLAMGVSTSAGGVKIWFSEDSGASVLTAAMNIFNAANTTSSGDWWDAESVATSNGRYGSMMLYNYASLTDKFVRETAIVSPIVSGWTGSRVLTSTAPINTVRYSSSAGIIDAGEVQVWGIL